MTLVLPFTNTYARLPQRFFVRIDPTPVSAPRLVRLNESLADNLGLDAHWLRSAEGVDVLAGKRVPEGAEPLAAAYAGHQFGHFVPQLGDGRATLLGEVIDRDGVRRDIQLKGSGRTPFSRQGDGRAALGPVLREYIVSEAMFALRIPTTRALAAVTTGETVYRETPLPGAVLTRVASSHIRVGTFQFFASRSDVDGLRTLADYVIARHYPEAAKAEGPYRALLEAAITSQADLVARWLLVGFIHGVMNTDNMSIAGETIDYGPCAFMDAYDPGTVYSSIDRQGRYAYGRQPSIAFWNLTRLAEAMLPLLDSDEKESIAIAERALQTFAAKFEGPFHAGLRRKIGLSTEQPNDLDLAAGLLKTMHEGAADFTLTFRGLSESAGEPERLKPVRSLFSNPSDFDAWAAQWLQRLTAESEDVDARRKRMQSVNPAFIPRNHLVEAAIAAAVEKDDYQPTHELMTVLSTPYEEQPVFAAYAAPPQPHERVQETFCGT